MAGKGTKYFEKGNSGRPKGSKNKLTTTVKETVLDAFNELQLDPKANLVAWGKKNPTPFYQIAAKLIPTEIQGKFEQTVNLPISKWVEENGDSKEQ